MHINIVQNFMKTLEGKNVIFNVESCESVLSIKKPLAAEHGVNFDLCVIRELDVLMELVKIENLPTVPP